MAEPQKAVRLGDWLLDSGHVTPSQLDLALREQKRKGQLLGETLLQLGFVSQQILAAFLAQKTQTERADLKQVAIAPEVLRRIPEPLARRLIAIPITLVGETLTIAIADPLNVVAFDELEQASAMRVNLVAAAESDILTAIDRFYGNSQSVEEIIDELLKQGLDKLASATEQDAPMIRLVNRIITDASLAGASDIHIQPEEKIVRARFRRDGILSAGILLPKEIQSALLARFKILGKLDITENRRPQDGRCTLEIAGRELGLRISSLPTAYGESIVLRLLDRGNLKVDFQSLGFLPTMQDQFRELLDRPHGVILVTGPTGSGKTTTLYTALQQLDAEEMSIFTLEDPIEYQLPLVRQTQISESIGLSFADGLRSLLRQDPDVILVGETRDTETAQLMVRAALTGHLVFTTLHTNDALAAVPRLIDLGVAPYLLGPTLNGVLAQRLVRRLCDRCRTPRTDSVEVLQRLNIASPVDLPPQLWQSGSCSECNGSGFRGRVGLYELMLIDERAQAAFGRELDFPKLQKALHDSGFRTMFDDGVSKALRGETTLEEVLKAVQK